MSNETTEHVNREYKDRLFTFIFGSEENRDWTLSLYNAVNGSHYTDSSLIKFNTLKDMLYMEMRNDTSFLISDVLSVYEHQSSPNPNMPLRLLDYVSHIYSGYVTEKELNKYGSKLIMLPTPKLVVFYNGIRETEDTVILKLSDSFNVAHMADADIEVRVKMFNVNYGRNRELMEACEPLKEYAWFIDQIRKNQNIGFEIVEAVGHAIETMPEGFTLKGFLENHREEVKGMLDTEFNEAVVWGRFQKEVDDEKKRADDAEKRADSEKKRADDAVNEVNDMKKQLEEKDRLLAKYIAENESLKEANYF